MRITYDDCMLLVPRYKYLMTYLFDENKDNLRKYKEKVRAAGSSIE